MTDASESPLDDFSNQQKMKRHTQTALGSAEDEYPTTTGKCNVPGNIRAESGEPVTPGSKRGAKCRE